MNITKDNINIVCSAIESLIENKAFFLEKMKEYPLQLTFANHTFTVSTEADIDSLIKNLQSSVDSPRSKLSLKITVQVDYQLNDDKVSNILDIVNQKMDLKMRSIIYPPVVDPGKKQAEIINFNYHIVPEEI